MGWKCPICLKDFGRDKDAQQKHMREEHNGAGADLEKIIRTSAEGESEESAQQEQ